jgi:hypothetical protein
MWRAEKQPGPATFSGRDSRRGVDSVYTAVTGLLGIRGSVNTTLISSSNEHVANVNALLDAAGSLSHSVVPLSD